MTKNLDKRPSLEKLLEAAPMLRRASLTIDPASSSALANGKPITPEMRDEILRRIDAGELGYFELDVTMLAYEQKAGEDNRNFVCFRDGGMRALGITGRGKPFLRDHDQGNSLARGGTLIESATKALAEGHYQILQTVRLTAPWAIEMYLRGLMTTVSIGWIPTGPVLCSACNAAVFEKCWHFPGERLEEVIGDDGGKRKVRKRDGAITVRWIYTAAELIETSCVPVPGVPTAVMDQLRATLAAQFPGLDTDEESLAHGDDDSKSTPSHAARSVDPQPEMNMPEPTAADPKQLASLRKALAVALLLPDEHRTHAATLDDEARETFLGASAIERDAAVKAALDADPVVFTGEVTGLTVRRSEGARAVQLAKLAEDGAASNKRHETALAKAAALAEDNEIATVCKTRLAKLPGSDEVHAYIVRSLRKGGGAPELIEAALTSLSGAAAAVERKAPGATIEEAAADGDGPEVKLAAFNAKLDAFAASKSQTPAAATEAFLATDEGDRLYSAYVAARG